LLNVDEVLSPEEHHLQDSIRWDRALGAYRRSNSHVEAGHGAGSGGGSPASARLLRIRAAERQQATSMVLRSSIVKHRSRAMSSCVRRRCISKRSSRNCTILRPMGE
jgi:hypothetical protein